MDFNTDRKSARQVVDAASSNYAGDNDELIGKEGVCAPIFRGCLREYEKGAEARTAAR